MAAGRRSAAPVYDRSAPDAVMSPFARILSLAVAATIVPGCASMPIAPGQRIEVIVEADDPKWAGPLDCEASNAAGAWRFVAPGAVEVLPSASPLRIACDVGAGASLEPSTTASKAATAAEAGTRKGAGVGTAIGAGAGIALAIAAAPLMGPAFALLLAAGGAAKGYQLGGLAGAMSTLGPSGYPSPIVLRIRSEPVPPAPAANPVPPAPCGPAPAE